MIAVAVVLLLAMAYAMRGKFVGRPAPPQPTATELDDKRILEEVDRVLDSSSALRRQEVGVKVENGVVFLDGHVDTKEESNIAENLTYSVVGVNGIKNNIVIGGKKPASKSRPMIRNPSRIWSRKEATAPGAPDATAQQRRVNQLMNEGKRRVEMGDYVIARDLFLAVLAIDPTNQKAEDGRRYARRMLIQQRRNAR